MTLQELFDRLALGELSQHKYGQSGSISTANQPAVINQVNMALTNLHSYFPLSEKELTLQQFDHITDYILDPLYAVSNNDPSINYKYIIDSDANPFTKDIIRIERAYDELGRQVTMNDEADACSWFTPAWDTIQVPFPNAENTSIIIYRANHPKIALDADPLNVEIEIPTYLEEALQAFVASRCYVSLGNASGAQLSSYYFQRYQEQIAHVERFSLLNQVDGDSNIKLGLKGFV